MSLRRKPIISDAVPTIGSRGVVDFNDSSLVQSLRAQVKQCPVSFQSRSVSSRPIKTAIGNLADSTVGLFTVDRHAVITVKGLLQLLQLCQVSNRYASLFSCHQRTTWRSLLQHAERTTNANLESFTNGAKLLSTTADVDAQVVNLNDAKAAAAYKRAFIDYVIYRALAGHRAYKNVDDFRREGWFNLIWFKGQIKTFLSHSNGSITMVLERLKEATAGLRNEDPFYPPIPADFFVGAIYMIKKAYEAEKKQVQNWRAKGGMSNIPYLIDAIKKNAFY
jgi:hypothetical protein